MKLKSNGAAWYMEVSNPYEKRVADNALRLGEAALSLKRTTIIYYPETRLIRTSTPEVVPSPIDDDAPFPYSYSSFNTYKIMLGLWSNAPEPPNDQPPAPNN